MSEEAVEANRKDQNVAKHLLQNEWEFWYFHPKNKDPKQSWENWVKKVHSFNTVEDFWKLYYHSEQPSRLGYGCDYNLFKAGIRPMWEDDANRKGGRIVMLFKKNAGKCQIDYLKKLEDKIWLEICLCLVGNAFGNDNDKITGLVFNLRTKLDRISIWINDFEDKEGITRIVNVIKKRIPIAEGLFCERHGNAKDHKNLIYRFRNATKDTVKLIEVTRTLDKNTDDSISKNNNDRTV